MAIPYPIVEGVTFKDVVGFPGYCVGDDGSIWSCWTNKSRMRAPYRKMKLPPITRSGYLSVGLTRDRKQIRVMVSTTVLTAFVGPRPEGANALHFPERDITNNRLSNLMWGTHVENQEHRKAQGTYRAGIQIKRAKLDDAKVFEARKRHYLGGQLVSEIAKHFDMTHAGMRSVITGKTWKHVPFPDIAKTIISKK